MFKAVGSVIVDHVCPFYTSSSSSTCCSPARKLLSGRKMKSWVHLPLQDIPEWANIPFVYWGCNVWCFVRPGSSFQCVSVLVAGSIVLGDRFHAFRSYLRLLTLAANFEFQRGLSCNCVGTITSQIQPSVRSDHNGH